VVRERFPYALTHGGSHFGRLVPIPEPIPESLLDEFIGGWPSFGRDLLVNRITEFRIEADGKGLFVHGGTS
jgi:hypothetical protein